MTDLNLHQQPLSQLFRASRQANRDLAAARNTRPRNQEEIAFMRARARITNQAYESARRQYKQAQKQNSKTVKESHHEAVR